MTSPLIVNTTYTGSEFNNLTKDKHFVRLTIEDENHNGFQYKTGLNIDTLPFNPIGNCTPGGLYFCEMKYFPIFLEYNDKICKKIRSVQIPDDSLVYIEDNKYKTDKFILGEAKEIYTDLNLCLEAVKYNGLVLHHIKEQTLEICLEAVKQNGYALQFVKEQTPEICMEAVKKNGIALQFVKEQTPEICIEAVKQNGYALQYVKEQTPEICMEAVKNNGICITICKRTNTRNMYGSS